ncbi:MAG: tRNA pseudouridine(55) synthase TruB [Candidatus Omnitrophica bacterium]|nr:tRNA pseudouridine(55) synthase TruB [Candidatus Omnitrophota bacterium]
MNKFKKFETPHKTSNLNFMSGILLVNKPQSWTSNDVCQWLKKRFRFKKVGHGGSLDPFATGLLVLYLEEATRQASQGLSDEKKYEGTIQLGLETSTGDPEGTLVCQMDVPSVAPSTLQNVFSGFIGRRMQTPPMTSAIKKNGTPLYRLARKGIEIARAAREIQIFELKMREFHSPYIDFYAHVSKGTYVRVLAQDIGKELGVPALLTRLHRVGSGKFTVEHALRLDQIQKIHSKDELLKWIIPARN